MARITALPPELLYIVLAIGYGQLALKDVFSVAFTCKYLSDIARKCLITHNITHDKSFILFWAIEKKLLKLAESALEVGADVNTVGFPPTEQAGLLCGTPLHYAAAAGYKDMVDLLLGFNAKLDAESWGQQGLPLKYSRWYPLHIAICYGHEEIALMIMNKRPPMEMENPVTTEDPMTIVDCAAPRGLDTIVQRALDMYPDILRKPPAHTQGVDFTRLPLHCTVLCWNSKSVIRCLLAAGCDIEATDELSMTPIWRACFEGNFATAMNLLNEGANTRSKWTRPLSMPGLQEHPSLLHLAVLGRGHYTRDIPEPRSTRADEQVAFVKALIEEHKHEVPGSILKIALKPRTVGHDGFTVKYRFADPVPALIRLLLEKGADPNLPDSTNLSDSPLPTDLSDSPLPRVVSHLLRPLRSSITTNLGHQNNRPSAVTPQFCRGEGDDDEFWEESDKKPDIACDVDTPCGLETNPWLCHLQDGSAELFIQRYTTWKLSDVVIAADAWETMVELIKFGAQPNTCTKYFKNTLSAYLVGCAVENTSGAHAYCLLNIFLQHYSSTWSNSHLNEMLQSCLVHYHHTLSGRGREAVSYLLVKYGASFVDTQTAPARSRLQETFLMFDDVWLATLCHERDWLYDTVDEIFRYALCNGYGYDRYERNSPGVARYFLQQSKEPTLITAEYQCVDANTALHIAALKGDLGLARALIKRGANVNALNAENLSPLHLSIKDCQEEPNLKLALLLLENGADPFWGDHLPATDPSQCICKATSCDADLDCRYHTSSMGQIVAESALSRAIRIGSPEMVKFLLQERQLGSQHPCTVCGYLRLSVHSRIYPRLPHDTISLLLKAGANPNGCGMCTVSPVTFYVKALRAPLLRDTPERTAAQRDLPLFHIHELIAAGADVNKPDADGQTAVSIMERILSCDNRWLSQEKKCYMGAIREYFSLVYDDMGRESICLLKDFTDPRFSESSESVG
ncbi:ankyrin repeat-containing domain protein [Nemania serpens]|nr:ankyrin repeat-containing domain protein [Nemania serpens]